MIVKKIKANRTKAKASSIRDLTNYISEPGKHEKVLYSNGRGFICDDHRSQQEEMIALASESVRSKSPVSHYILSWQEGEQPSPEQVERTVNIFLDELGLKDHQAVYGLHKNTDNIHLHLAINRVHPETLKIIEINKGFDIESAHKAISKIEHEQGWQREQNGRYQVLENGDLGRAQTDLGKKRQPSQPKRDMENRTGEKSAERIAIEVAAPIIKRAASWQELHLGLAAKGMRYERTGSGAILFVGDVGVKASSADRNASLSKLQKRLGIFEPSTQDKSNVYFQHEPKEPHLSNPLKLSENRLRNLSECHLAHYRSSKTQGVLSLNARAYRRESERVRREPPKAIRPIKPQPIKPDVPGWNDYITGRKAHYADKAAAKLELDERQEAERKQLAKQQKMYRDERLQGCWKGRGELRNTIQSVLAGEQAAEKAALKERHRHEREQWRLRYRPYPDLEQWLRQQKHPELAEQWRHRDSEPQCIVGSGDEPPIVVPRGDIRDYEPERWSAGVLLPS